MLSCAVQVDNLENKTSERLPERSLINRRPASQILGEVVIRRGFYFQIVIKMLHKAVCITVRGTEGASLSMACLSSSHMDHLQGKWAAEMNFLRFTRFHTTSTLGSSRRGRETVLG